MTVDRYALTCKIASIERILPQLTPLPSAKCVVFGPGYVEGHSREGMWMRYQVEGYDGPVVMVPAMYTRMILKRFWRDEVKIKVRGGYMYFDDGASKAKVATVDGELTETPGFPECEPAMIQANVLRDAILVAKSGVDIPGRVLRAGKYNAPGVKVGFDRGEISHVAGISGRKVVWYTMDEQWTDSDTFLIHNDAIAAVREILDIGEEPVSVRHDKDWMVITSDRSSMRVGATVWSDFSYRFIAEKYSPVNDEVSVDWRTLNDALDMMIAVQRESELTTCTITVEDNVMRFMSESDGVGAGMTEIECVGTGISVSVNPKLMSSAIVNLGERISMWHSGVEGFPLLMKSGPASAVVMPLEKN